MAREQGPLAKFYLAVYNFVQLGGWSYGLWRFVNYYLAHGTYIGSWEEVRGSVSFFQTLQLIEVVHNLIGLVPSSAFTTFIQILSRLVVVWGILESVPESRASLGLPMLMSAWSLAEMTRYAYYGLNLIGAVPYPLLWARYTFFTFLYPIGVTGELLTMYTAWPYLVKRNLYSVPLPNMFNVSFYFYYIIAIIAASYIPFFPQLYGYMLRQRKKMLSPPPKAADKTK